MISESLITQLVTHLQSVDKFCGATKVITIDGPAGSGKTTLANELSSALGNCLIVHMDDLYAGWNQDLITELADRITSQILNPISFGKTATYMKYDWAEEDFKVSTSVPISDFLILEGVGAGHPKLNSQAALNIWIEADPKILLDRLVKRDGEQLREQLTTWQTHEARYFDQLAIKDLADVHLTGD